MKQVTLFIIAIFLSIISFAINDSLPSLPKNRINVGITNFSFLDGYGFKFSNRNGMGIFGLASFEYQRELKNQFVVSLGFSSYYREYYNEKKADIREIGDMLLKVNHQVSLSAGKLYEIPFKKNLRPFVLPQISTMYRYGAGDNVFLAYNPRDFGYHEEMVRTKGFGLGIGTDIGIIAYNRISLAVSLNYTHVFEMNKYLDFYSKFQHVPSRNMLMFVPKIGFLF